MENNQECSGKCKRPPRAAPVYKCKYGHLICSECLIVIKKGSNNACPALGCNVILGEKRSHSSERLIPSTLNVCKHDGCTGKHLYLS